MLSFRYVKKNTRRFGIVYLDVDVPCVREVFFMRIRDVYGGRQLPLSLRHIFFFFFFMISRLNVKQNENNI